MIVNLVLQIARNQNAKMEQEIVIHVLQIIHMEINVNILVLNFVKK